MDVVDLDGKPYKINLSSYKANANIKKSELHLRARGLLKNIYPTLQILEEVTVTLRYGHIVYLDFFIPLNRKCIEVHGEQHYNFTSFYHSTKLDFLKQKKRDREKQEWCNINAIGYVELPFNRINDWENIINES